MPDESKYEIIKNYPIPTNAESAKRFVAFCNYYRRFIRNFAEIASPINKLSRKNAPFLWTPDCQRSFEILKKALIEPQILQYPDFGKHFILTTDASKEACGAILSQDFNGEELPIAYASKSFTKGEANKATIEQELTAIHFAIHHFRPYLYGNKFLVKSDHKPLVYLFSMKNPSSKLTIMRLDLEEYDFEVQYIKGKNNVGADALSRISINDLKMLQNESAQILAVTRSMTRNEEIAFNNTKEEEEIKRPKIYETLDIFSTRKIPLIRFDFRSKYLRIFLGKKGSFSAETEIKITNDSISLEKILSQTEKMAGDYKLKNLKLNIKDQIFQKCTINEVKEVGQSVLKNISITLFKDPQIIKNREEKTKLIGKYHDNPLFGGHSGQKKLLKKLRMEYRWKGMSRDVALYVKNCRKCQLNKKKSTHVEPMVITPTPQKAFDIVCIDTIGPFTKSVNNNLYAVTIQCELTKYIIIVPIPNKEAVTIAKAIMNECILIYGPMKEIRTDLGTEYKNEVLHQLTKLLKIGHNFSTAYHSQTIGGCERNHRVLNEFIRMYISDAQTDWDEWIKYYSFCYNTTPSIYHNYTPFELVFARKAEIDEVLLGTRIDPVYNIDAYYQEVRYRLQYASKRAHEFIAKAKEIRKINYDKNRTKNLHLKPGDLVLLSNENRTKFDPWYKGPFSVVKSEGVNCIIKNENGKESKVHKNRLQPFIQTISQ